MKSRRIWGVAATALVVALGAIPAATGASPQTKAGSDTLCTATGKIPMGNAGAISLKASGKQGGTSVSCAVKVKGKWAKNSTTFSVDATGTATLGKGGAFTVDPKANLKPFTGKVAGTVTGSGLDTGTAIWVEFHCWYSYPPLRYGCEIIIHTGPPPSGAPRHSVRAAPQMKTGSTLCSATGTKPLGNTGVVRVSVKGTAAGATGTPMKCSGLLTGKWAKNSTQFSWDMPDQKVTLGPNGSFKALSGVVMGPKGKVAGTLTGGPGPGTSITIDVGCDISYPPLKIRCWIIISAA